MSNTTVAKDFFEACENGRGWAVCSTFCIPYATFSSQAEPLEKVVTLEQYSNWMQGMLAVLTDGKYDLKYFAADDERHALRICDIHRYALGGRTDRAHRQDDNIGLRLLYAI
jgi:hypothetical protein